MAGERVLIVEDEVAIQARRLERLLKKAGYEVVGIAETEEEAIAMARSASPAVVLMDIQLVDSEGNPDRCAGLRAAHRIMLDVGARIIFLTGIRADEEVQAGVQKVRNCEFLTKPVAAQTLLALCKSVLDAKSREELGGTASRKISSLTEDAAPSHTLFLNAWFPGQRGADVRLRVGHAAKFLVNIGPNAMSGTGMSSEEIARQSVAMLCCADCVSVLVLCAGADIMPPAVRLSLRPRLEGIAEFSITPRRQGDLKLTVVLLIRGEPIHKSCIKVTAESGGEAASHASIGGPT